METWTWVDILNVFILFNGMMITRFFAFSFRKQLLAQFLVPMVPHDHVVQLRAHGDLKRCRLVIVFGSERDECRDESFDFCVVKVR